MRDLSPKHREPPYQDTGCEFSPSCLSCPLPTCKEDLTPYERHKLRLRLRSKQRATVRDTERDKKLRQIVYLYESGWSMTRIGTHLDVNTSTIASWLNKFYDSNH